MYYFRPDDCLVGTAWKAKLVLRALHRSSGGVIEACSLHFDEYEDGECIDGVHEPLEVVYSHLTWL